MTQDEVTRREYETALNAVRESIQALTSERSTVSLREYLEKLMDERFSSHSAVHRTAEGVMENRLDRLNELRDLVGDIKGGYVTSETYQVNHKSLEKTTSSNADRISAIEGRFLGLALAAVALGAAGTIISLVK